MFIPDPSCFHLRSRIQGQQFSRIRIRNKDLSIFTQKMVSKLSEIWSGMFISDPDLDFFLPMPDPVVKKAPDPGYRSATLLGIDHKNMNYMKNEFSSSLRTMILTWRTACRFFP
jgi:hypothetical protein